MKNKIRKLASAFRPFQRARTLRLNEDGSVMLAAGMMVFLGTIFSLIAFDTNMAVYNRITAQNAVDSAADAAALWQARGCNLEQQLNNLHYTVDTGAAVAEGIATAACVVSVALEAAQFIPIIGAAAAAARVGTCIACDTLPGIDYAQQLFYKALMPIQEGLADAIPFLAFADANACAKGSGADKLLDAIQGATQGLLSSLGVDLPGFGDIAGAISGGLDFVPLYAAPLDPNSLKLFVDKKDTDDLPWNWPAEVGEAGQIAGEIGCPESFSSVMSSVQGAGWDGNWGWKDQYYFGNPGFMTWIAGKAKRDELLGLGKLKWLNGGQAKVEDFSRVMYTGEVNISDDNKKLEIPGFVAFASSQVEGTPVISHGDVDAQNKLISVHFSANSTGDKFFIFH
jgi:hypothetical protein